MPCSTPWTVSCFWLMQTSRKRRICQILECHLPIIRVPVTCRAHTMQIIEQPNARCVRLHHAWLRVRKECTAQFLTRSIPRLSDTFDICICVRHSLARGHRPSKHVSFNVLLGSCAAVLLMIKANDELAG
jgi:hypothetical protein